MDRAKASRSFLGVPGPDDQEDEDPPDPGGGDQDAERTRPHDGSPGGRDR